MLRRFLRQKLASLTRESLLLKPLKNQLKFKQELRSLTTHFISMVLTLWALEISKAILAPSFPQSRSSGSMTRAVLFSSQTKRQQSRRICSFQLDLQPSNPRHQQSLHLTLQPLTKLFLRNPSKKQLNQSNSMKETTTQSWAGEKLSVLSIKWRAGNIFGSDLRLI